MDKKNAKHDLVTRFFILMLYHQRVIPKTAAEYATFEDDAIKLYRSDPVFHAMVAAATARIMFIFDDLF